MVAGAGVRMKRMIVEKMDHPEARDAASDGAGTLMVVYDQAARLIRTGSHGVCTPEQVDRHFAELRAARDLMREQLGYVLILADLRGSVVQSPETTARVQAGTEASFAPDDRVALIVSSSLEKMQRKRYVTAPGRQLFISENAAIIWLRAWS